ncbi:MAG: heme ABC transporter ATP-binding protein [Alphaproteobacteria bacterium]
MMILKDTAVIRRGRRVLQSITTEVKVGEVAILIGPNGAGKSTLLQTMGGDILPATGTVRLQEKSLAAWTALDLARHRSMMAQSTTLGFTLPVRDVVALGRSPFHAIATQTQNNHAIEEAMNLAAVSALASRSYNTLSGGEQQRVQFARALAQIDLGANRPRLLLLDEPTASLDPAHAHHVMKVVRNLAVQGIAVIAAIHDLALAYRYATKVIVLQRGQILVQDTPVAAMTPAILAATFGIDTVHHEGNLVIRGLAVSGSDDKDNDKGLAA